jgi:small-conductance mechanosensitive channel
LTAYAATFVAAAAQAAESQVPAGAEKLVEEARKSGSTVIVISPAEQSAAAPAVAQAPASDSLQMALGRAAAEVRHIIDGWGALVAQAESAIASYGSDGTSRWIFSAWLLGLALLAIGAGVAWALGRLAQNYFTTAFGHAPTTRSGRIAMMFLTAIVRFVPLAVVLLIALLIGTFVWSNQAGWQPTLSSFLLWAAVVGCVWIIAKGCFAPDRPALRMLRLTDAEAQRVFRHLMIAALVPVTLLGLCRWIMLLGVPRDVLKPALILAYLLTAIGFSATAILNRHPIARLIAGSRTDYVNGFRRNLSRIWPALAVTYFSFAFLVSAVRLLLDRPNSFGLVAMPIMVVIGGFALYGLALLFIDISLPRRAPLETGEADRAVSADDRSVLHQLLEQMAGAVAFAAAAFALAGLWGLQRLAGPTVTGAAIQIVAVIIVAYFAYHAARLWIDRRIANESQRLVSGGAGTQSSRVGTLLPIFRNFLLVAIGATSVMIVLSRLGVDIGPLLAGAGVVGLAVGFGAQTLVKDIISGAFFLADDAFRLGEYIDIGSGMGTVEQISIRSMRLRHQDGPLNTVPFGSIDKVTNFSRDWAVTKLPIRLAHAADVDRVRKLVKQLGAELMKDPEIGPMFLQPVKSQGISTMDESGMVVQVRFMTRPSDASMARRAVYARLRELFAREQIQFAQKEVRVRIEGENGGERHLPSRDERAAAIAAVQSVVLEDEMRAARSSET